MMLPHSLVFQPRNFRLFGDNIDSFGHVYTPEFRNLGLPLPKNSCSKISSIQTNPSNRTRFISQPTNLQYPNLKYYSLSIYREIFQIARQWPVLEQAAYIHFELRHLFGQNRLLTDQNIIWRKLVEANSRIELALHYEIPYPRPTHIPSEYAHIQSEYTVPVYLSSHNDSQTKSLDYRQGFEHSESDSEVDSDSYSSCWERAFPKPSHLA